MKYLFLYSHLAGYFIAGLEVLAKRESTESITILCNKPDSIAPFKLRHFPKLTVKYSDELTKDQIRNLIFNTDYQLIFVSGWVNLDYLRAIKKVKETRPHTVTVLGLDNPWKNTFRQRIGGIVFDWIGKPVFDFAWVPGSGQFKFAQRLGFQENQIENNLYSADSGLFKVDKSLLAERKDVPHQVLYVGRFVKEKGLDELVEAFSKIPVEVRGDWTLRLIGNGNPPLIPSSIKHQTVVSPFVQPHELPQVFNAAGLFCLPSHFEHWGVVVHEAALCGLPLVLAENCGAASAFLDPAFSNGFSFQPKNVIDLASQLSRFMQLSPKERVAMSLASFELGSRLNLSIWADTLIRMARSKNNS